MKRVLEAFSGRKSSTKKREERRERLDENAADSPALGPKRLLTPGGSLPRGRQASALVDMTAGGTPRSINFDDRSPTRGARLQREGSLRGSPALPRVASTPARTPARQPSRLGSQAMVGPAAAAGVAADGGGDAAAASDNIRVVLRVRPRNEREAGMGGGVGCLQPLGTTGVRVASHPDPHQFSFDYVAGDGTSQDTIFRVAGKPIVENCLAGYNGCIFAYGQTGSGKTYTMLGGGDGGEAGGRDDTSRGLIQRVFEHLFARIAEGGGKYLLECSFLEIYNETITDLLDPTRTNLQVRENLEGQYVSNLTAHEVYRVEDVVALLRTGQANRRVGETNMNERSSRSHSVFTCKLQSKTVDAYGTSHVRCSRLHLVDLAGSERQKASGAQGERLKEATAINKSLSALGNVIMSLVDQQHGRARHIPYRDSRLTYLLQDSLGGNAKTCLVAAVSPAAVNMAETLSTLRFADQAKRIKNQAVVNEDTDGDRAALKREIKRLNQELAAAQRAGAAAAAGHAAGAAAAGLEPLSGTPSRLAAAADAILAATSPGGGGGGLGRRQALMGALRREDNAVKDVHRLRGEVESMRDLLKAKESDLQRSQMMMKLKESRLARLQAGSGGNVPVEVSELQQEIDLLRGKVEAHPEVKRFAVENLRLSEDVKRFEAIVQRGELAALGADVDVLRGEMLRMEEDLKRAQAEAALAAEQATAARLEAEASAEAIRAKAVEETQAKVAVELSQLRQQLFEQQRAARGGEAQLTAATRDNEELQARVELLQETVVQLESCHTTLRGELSPVKRQARDLEHELGLARQEGQAAEMRATSEATLRGQAEMASVQLQARLATLEAEAAALRAANQELFRAKSDAEEQRGSVAGVEAQVATLRSQLEREQALAAERQADHADALQQLEGSRQRAAELELESQASQREAMEVRAELERAQAEHEAALMAAAERAAAAAKEAAGATLELEASSMRLGEAQAERERLQLLADDLTQRCTQLHDENVHMASMLAQRDNELLDMEQTIEDTESKLAAQKAGADKLAADLEAAQRELAEKGEELAGASAELEAARDKLAEATAAMQDAHDQLAELQERLAVAEEQQAQAEYELSDKSASLSEVQEQLGEVRRQLGEAREAHAAAAAAAEQSGAAAEEAAQQLEAANARAAELATALAAAEEELVVHSESASAQQAVAAAAAAAAAAALAERERDLAKQRAAALAAQQQAGELAAQLHLLQQGTLLEKEQQLLLGRAEVKELREQLAAQEDAADKLQAQLETRDVEMARLRQEMAAEVSEAAQQVQLLLAAQGRVEALEGQLEEARTAAAEHKAAARVSVETRVAALEGELAEARAATEEREAAAAHFPLKVAEAVAAARADARRELDRLEGLLAEREQEVTALRGQFEEAQAEMADAAGATTVAAQEQINQLVAEREAWIEEVQAQRAEASAAVEASRALERRFAELAEERGVLAAALEEAQGRCDKLETELTHLTGQQNLNQRIQYHKKVKEENDVLREELGRLRIDHHRVQVRYDRVTGELHKLRGDGSLPDFEAEEALRDALAATEAQKRQLERELEGLARSVLSLAPRQAASGGEAAGLEAESSGGDDIVLELVTPRPQRGEHHGDKAGAADAASAARRALADISAQQAAAARSLEDQRQQIRLLKEAAKVAKLRRGSALPAAPPAAGKNAPPSAS